MNPEEVRSAIINFESSLPSIVQVPRPTLKNHWPTLSFAQDLIQSSLAAQFLIHAQAFIYMPGLQLHRPPVVLTPKIDAKEHRSIFSVRQPALVDPDL
jgi:hypothetical protein